MNVGRFGWLESRYTSVWHTQELQLGESTGDIRYIRLSTGLPMMFLISGNTVIPPNLCVFVIAVSAAHNENITRRHRWKKNKIQHM